MFKDEQRRGVFPFFSLSFLARKERKNETFSSCKFLWTWRDFSASCTRGSREYSFGNFIGIVVTVYYPITIRSVLLLNYNTALQGWNLRRCCAEATRYLVQKIFEQLYRWLYCLQLFIAHAIQDDSVASHILIKVRKICWMNKSRILTIANVRSVIIIYNLFYHLHV